MLAYNNSIFTFKIFNHYTFPDVLWSRFLFRVSKSAVVGPIDFLIKFPWSLYTVRHFFNVTRPDWCELSWNSFAAEPLGELTVYDGLGTRIFIRPSSLLDVDSPLGSSRPLQPASRVLTSLAILKAQRPFSKPPWHVLWLAHRLISCLSPVEGRNSPLFFFVRRQLVSMAGPSCDTSSISLHVLFLRFHLQSHLMPTLPNTRWLWNQVLGVSFQSASSVVTSSITDHHNSTNW